MKPIEPPAKDTAGKILQASKKLFAQMGYDGVSIKKISQEAGANSALISYYFGGKLQLYQAVLKQQADAIIDAIEALKHSPLPPLQWILVFMDEQTRLHLKDPDSMQVLYREFLTPVLARNDSVHQRMLEIYESLAGAFDAARTQRAVSMDADGHRAAFTLISIFSFYLLMYRYEALNGAGQLPGNDDFSRLRGVYLDYLKSLATKKGELL